MRELTDLTAQDRYAEAAARVEKAKENYGRKNALLYYLDRGMLLHLAGAYDESNRAFEAAKRLAAELFTKSVTTEASTFLASDNLRPYHGEDFERALIHVFSALNYLFLGKDEDALVEVRQVDFLLTKLQTDYGHKNTYTEDAFARYLAGLIYEDQGQINDAFISYRKALEAYERYKKDYGVAAPAPLVRDALRTAQALGFDDEIREIGKRWGGGSAAPGPLPRGAGEAVVVHYNGPPPRKLDYFFEIGFFAGWAYVDAVKPEGREEEQVEQASQIAKSILADELVRIAFPKYERSPYVIRRLDVRAGVPAAPETSAALAAPSSTAPAVSVAVTDESPVAHPAELAEDVGAIAIKNLQDRVARIRAKAIARAVVKFALSRRIAADVAKKQGEGAGWLAKKILQVASNATELTDKRSWQTLPDRIAVARVTLPAGEQKLRLTFRDADGKAVSSREETVIIRPGRRTFLTVRTVQ